MLCVAGLVVGLVLYMDHGADEAANEAVVAALNNVDPEEEFTLHVCKIDKVEHSYETERRQQEWVEGATPWDQCKDIVTYTFVVQGEEGVYKEREQRHYRKEEVKVDAKGLGWEDVKDVCQGPDGYASDLVCGSLCSDDQTVPCWKPHRSCTTRNCEEDLFWANCGNAACYKVIDPKIEHDMNRANLACEMRKAECSSPEETGGMSLRGWAHICFFVSFCALLVPLGLMCRCMLMYVKKRSQVGDGQAYQS
eukprot:gnl/TRDRNA2_/TRDRNA2_166037_c2_seq5.p1 gnl/TRDRNA2_/TRDRNA2_166037_c2~~gnl/TRDRNA2_/TRDRNA2_166037_c2_seq5.p1  ORF type:complete len:287 (+),score=30.83 gnl/TRDRNA2_/TRDRNA2_166037_c2_seq5:109-861(+)